MKSLQEILFNSKSQMTESLFDKDIIQKSPINWVNLYEFILSRDGKTIDKDEWKNYIDDLNVVVNNLKQVKLRYSHQAILINENKMYLHVDLSKQHLILMYKKKTESDTRMYQFQTGVFDILLCYPIDMDDITDNGFKSINFGVVSFNNKELREFNRFIDQFEKRL